MTTFTASFSTAPNNRGVPADDLVNRLCSQTPASASGPFGAGFLVLISFGLLPLILWPMRWAAFLDGERNDLLELMSRWRSRVAPGDAHQLDQIARRFRPRPMLMVLPWLMAGFTGMMMAVLLARGGSPEDISDLTYDHVGGHHTKTSWVERSHLAPRFTDTTGFPDDMSADRDLIGQIRTHLFNVWAYGLLAAYCVHWYAVRSHTRAVDSLVNWTNRVASTNGLPLVRNEALGTGLGLMWIILAIVLCGANAWWGIPLALGGAMQRRYTRSISGRIRNALGCQLRDGFNVAMATAPTSRFCGGAHCGARLPAAANFCPRCGSAAVSARV